MVPDTKLVPEVGLPSTRSDTLLIIQAFRLLVCDACGITEAEYTIVVQQFLADIDNKDAQAVGPSLVPVLKSSNVADELDLSNQPCLGIQEGWIRRVGSDPQSHSEEAIII